MNDKVKSKKQDSLALRESLRKNKNSKAMEKKSRLAQANEELTILDRLIQKVTAQLSLQKACDVAVEELSAARGVDLVVLFVQEGGALHLKAVGPSSSYLQIETLPVHVVGECLCGLAARTGRMITSHNIHKDIRCTMPECKRAGLHSFAAIPLHIGKEPVGVLGIASAGERDFKKTSRFLKKVAERLSVCIHHARMFEQTQTYAIQLEQQIAEGEKSEKMLQKNRSDLMVILDNLPFLAWLKDSEGRFIAVNVPFAHASGHSAPEDLIGKTDLDIWPKHLAESYRADDNAVMLSRKKKTVEEVISDQGDDRWFETYKAPLFDVDGKVTGTTGFARDISDRKRADEAIRRERQFTETLLESLPGLFYLYELDIQSPANSRLIRFNRKHSALTGYTPEELLGMKIKDWFEPDVLEEAVRAISIISERGEVQVNLTLCMKDGSQVPFAFTGRLLTIDGKMYFLGMGIDISNFVRAQEALKESEEKYRLVVENANDAIMIVQDGRLKFPNRQAIALSGYSEEELTSIPFLAYVYDADKDVVIEMHRKRLHGQDVPVTYSFRIIKKSGEIVWVEATAVLVTWEGSPATLTFLRDITVQKRLEEQLLHAQKMEAIGTLAGGVAHDFNNLLMGIIGYTSLMLMKTDKTHPFHEKLKIIERQVESGAELTKQLLGFARGGKYEVKPINVNDLIIRTSDIFGRTKKEITIHKKLQEDLHTIEGDSGQVEQVLFNLYVNGWQAMPSGGNLYLETRNVMLNEQQCRAYNTKPGPYIKISVSDTGVGMDAETQKRIFEPFFTTKGVGKGTGLGLASAYGIIKNHGGIINVYSEKGYGTTFTIYLPPSEARAAEAKPAEGGLLTGHETILIVDDEPINIEAVTELLEALGYKVLTAQSGRKAIELYKKHPGKIQLVILDMIMPGMNGKETLRKLMEMDKNVRVLLASGYSIDGEAKTILDLGCKGFIQKPFRAEELSRKIRDVLDSRHP